MSFNQADLVKPFLEYLGAPAVANPILSMVRNIVSEVTLGDVVDTAVKGRATPSIVALARKMGSFGGMLESGMKMIFRLFFESLNPSDSKVDLIQTNLKWVLEV